MEAKTGILTYKYRGHTSNSICYQVRRRNVNLITWAHSQLFVTIILPHISELFFFILPSTVSFVRPIPIFALHFMVAPLFKKRALKFPQVGYQWVKRCLKADSCTETEEGGAIKWNSFYYFFLCFWFKKWIEKS